MPTIATATRVQRDDLLDFVRPRHRYTLLTHKRTGGVQLSPVAGGVDTLGRLVVATYPDRAKAVNLRRDPEVSVLVHSDEWNDAYVQVDGTAEVLDMYPHQASRLPRSAAPGAKPGGGPEDMPAQEAEDALVDYFRCIAGEHSDWEEYREAMRKQNKSLIRITVTGWGPIATGGFPPGRARPERATHE